MFPGIETVGNFDFQMVGSADPVKPSLGIDTGPAPVW